MKIDETVPASPGSGGLPPESPAREESSSGLPRVDYAALFSGAGDAEPDIDDAARRERVEAIRARLAAGSYNISGKDVAEKMLKALKS